METLDLIDRKIVAELMRDATLPIAAIGEKVLVVDLDPQGNASTGLGIEHRDRGLSTYEIMSGDEVVVESTNRQYKIKGIVSEVGSRIIEYPNRLKGFREIEAYGRELFIKIPEESNFLNGEKVFVILNK